MPPQVAARAFEAFYTTKDAGKGTGLGLHIARRIVVERHNGTITTGSRPGETALCVRIPVRPPSPGTSGQLTRSTRRGPLPAACFTPGHDTQP